MRVLEWIRTHCKFADAALQIDAAAYDKAFPRAGAVIDGRAVRQEVPNMSSIGASFNDYEVLDGIREVQMSNFSSFGYANHEENIKSQRLAELIASLKEINPLIVVVDKEGIKKPYVLEGGHRLDALHLLKAKSFPALIVLDLDS